MLGRFRRGWGAWREYWRSVLRPAWGFVLWALGAISLAAWVVQSSVRVGPPGMKEGYQLFVPATAWLVVFLATVLVLTLRLMHRWVMETYAPTSESHKNRGTLDEQLALGYALLARLPSEASGGLAALTPGVKLATRSEIDQWVLDTAHLLRHRPTEQAKFRSPRPTTYADFGAGGGWQQDRKELEYKLSMLEDFISQGV